MAHTYTSCFIHAVFSTRRRQPILSATTRARLRDFIAVTAAKNGFRILTAGGADDHIHILMKVPSTMPIARAVQLLKKRTAIFMGKPDAWQEGFVAVTISASAVDETVAYIERQEDVHSAKTFEEETIALFKKHRIRYDLRYVFD